MPWPVLGNIRGCWLLKVLPEAAWSIFTRCGANPTWKKVTCICISLIVHEMYTVTRPFDSPYVVKIGPEGQPPAPLVTSSCNLQAYRGAARQSPRWLGGAPENHGLPGPVTSWPAFSRESYTAWRRDGSFFSEPTCQHPSASQFSEMPSLTKLTMNYSIFPGEQCVFIYWA